MKARLKLFINILLITAVIYLLINSNNVVKYFLNGITIWAYSVFPTLLPYMLLCRLIYIQNKNWQPSRVAFLNCPKQSISIVLLGWLCGNPMSSKLIADSHNNNQLTTTQCVKTFILSATASPIFIIATVGNIMLNSTLSGMIILVSHLLGILINGLIHLNIYIDNTIQAPKICATQSNIMLDSILSVLVVGGYIAVFYTIGQCVLSSLPAKIPPQLQLIITYLLGLLEMTVGCQSISQISNAATATVLCCSLVSFGGLCIALQCMTFIQHCNIKLGTILTIKAMHCAISTIICYLLCLLML